MAKEMMWHENRLHRMIVDFMLRNDHYQSAEHLVKRAGVQVRVNVLISTQLTY